MVNVLVIDTYFGVSVQVDFLTIQVGHGSKDNVYLIDANNELLMMLDFKSSKLEYSQTLKDNRFYHLVPREVK